MAIAPDFEHDIFISYAHADNREGWVTQFEDCLESALRQRLGGAGKFLKVFFDRDATGANYRLPELLDAVNRSALFVAVGSPCYVDSDWAVAEIDTFVRRSRDLSRIFVIELLPLNEGVRYPPAIEHHIRLRFWKSAKIRHTPMSLSPSADEEDFLPLVHTLAVDLRDKLTSLRVLPSPHSSVFVPDQTASTGRPNGHGTESSVDSSRGKKTVLLAQVTDDVEEEAEQLRRYLKQFTTEVAILPSSAYPQGGDTFRASFAADIARAGLFVQLLGKRPGRTPPDLPEGYTKHQLDVARAAGIPIMQWRHPDLDVGTVNNPGYQSILTAETVVASGFEAFKQQILQWAREPEPKPRSTRSSTIFINADDKDMPIAKEVERECLQKALTTILPMTSASTEANRKDLEANLTECDLLVFICGETTQEWIRSQLRFFSKIKAKRESEPRLLAICSGPPPKGDIGIKLPNARFINCPEGWNLDEIRNLLSVEDYG